MAYEFVDYIKPQGESKFYILEDKFIKGGFHIVDTKSELDSLDPTIMKKGMLVAVNEEDGAIYECAELTLGEDE
jgi:hypothetical protein